MKLYYESQLGKLYLADAIDLLRSIPNESVDLILTDPPYNISDGKHLVKRKGKTTTRLDEKQMTSEEYIMWMIKLIKEFHRVLKPEGQLIIFLDRYMGGRLIYYFETVFIFRNKLYFEKLNPVPHFRKNNYRSCIEEAYWFTKGNKYYLNFISQQEMKQIFRGTIGKKATEHPNEKYKWMIEPLLIRHSREGDIVLDPFCGSGTIPYLCEKLKRKWIAGDKNIKWVETTKKRIEEGDK